VKPEIAEHRLLPIQKPQKAILKELGNSDKSCFQTGVAILSDTPIDESSFLFHLMIFLRKKLSYFRNVNRHDKSLYLAIPIRLKMNVNGGIHMEDNAMGFTLIQYGIIEKIVRNHIRDWKEEESRDLKMK
jgi:hypothetical protein